MSDQTLVHDGHPLQIDPETLPWLQIQDGIDCKLLFVNRELGHWSIYQRAKAGTILPYHLHHAPSIFWSVKGEGDFPDGKFKPGDYFFEAAGVYHYATRFQTDTEILFHSYGGVTFFEDDKKTIRYQLDWRYLQNLADEHARRNR